MLWLAILGCIFSLKVEEIAQLGRVCKSPRGSFKIFVSFGLRKWENSKRRAKKEPPAQREHEQIPPGAGDIQL